VVLSLLEVVVSLLDVPPLDELSGGTTTVVVSFSTRVVVLLLAGGLTTTAGGASAPGLAGAGAGLFTMVVSEVPDGTTATLSVGRLRK
jgi:hypothetical protein